MSKFITRVELIGSNSIEDYKKLHKAMSEEGFYQTYYHDGKYYHLPDAEYYSANETESTISTRQKAIDVCTSLGFEFRLLVTQASDIKLWNLNSSKEPIVHNNE